MNASNECALTTGEIVGDYYFIKACGGSDRTEFTCLIGSQLDDECSWTRQPPRGIFNHYR